MNTEKATPSAEIEILLALVEAQDEYNKLISEEAQDLVVMASIHGWKSTKYEEGVKMREKITRLRNKLSEYL